MWLLRFSLFLGTPAQVGYKLSTLSLNIYRFMKRCGVVMCFVYFLLLAFQGGIAAPVIECDRAASVPVDVFEHTYTDVWAKFAETNGGWVIVPAHTESGIPIYKLSDEKTLTMVLGGDLRIGLNRVQGIASNGHGQLALVDYFNQHMFVTDLNAATPSMAKVGQLRHMLGAPFFVEKDVLLVGNGQLRVMSCDEAGRDDAQRINRLLSDDRLHESMADTNFHKMHFTRMDEIIAVGYSFSDFIDLLEIRGTTMVPSQVKHAFRGYQAFPSRWIKGTGSQNKAFYAKLESGHSLIGLASDGHAIYGKYRLGFAETVIWARIWPNREFFYANKDKETKLFAIGRSSTLIGHRHDDEAEDLSLCVAVGPPLHAWHNP